MPNVSCTGTLAVLQAIEDGYVAEIHGPIDMMIPIDNCELHFMDDMQFLVIRAAPALQILGNATTNMQILGPGSPTLGILGVSAPTILIDLATPPDGPVPIVTVGEDATPTITVLHGAPMINLGGASKAILKILNDAAPIVSVDGNAEPQIYIETTGAFTLEYAGAATGYANIQAAPAESTVCTLGTSNPTVDVRERAATAFDMAGTSHPHVLTWDDAAASFAARETAQPSVSTYHRSNLVLGTADDATITVDGHNNSQLQVSGSIAVAADRGIAVLMLDNGPTVTGTCLKQTLTPLGPPILVPPGPP